MDAPKKTYLRKNDYVSRVLTLAEIDDYSSNDIIAAIYEINELDRKLPPVKREPIKLIVNSNGGSVYDGFGIIDAIEVSTTPIHTICHGCVMSMALPVFCAGKYRVISKYATIMYHEIIWETDTESLRWHKNEVKESERLQILIDQYIVSKTSISPKQINRIKKLNKDWYITPEEALELKIVNKII